MQVTEADLIEIGDGMRAWMESAKHLEERVRNLEIAAAVESAFADGALGDE